MAAVYLHKKFPRATESVATGIAKATAWTAKKFVKKIAGQNTLSAPATATSAPIDSCPIMTSRSP